MATKPELNIAEYGKDISSVQYNDNFDKLSTPLANFFNSSPKFSCVYSNFSMINSIKNSQKFLTL